MGSPRQTFLICGHLGTVPGFLLGALWLMWSLWSLDLFTPLLGAKSQGLSLGLLGSVARMALTEP